ncbi:FHY [Symbiodinium necroappetens]|uniref:riboflavin kinase n=1 Tax=Symbiodinium necroappetens TaxID=1628268 RepID=A0A813AU60_9DINO|nr:FHY [Symbiodinium necroappetens]
MQVYWDRDVRDLSEQERAMRDFAETHRAGIYCAWGSIEEAVGGQEVHKVALSMGWNPTFTDVKAKTVEPWILHNFDQDFYGCHLRLLVLAYIRPELKFDTIEQLKQEIALDGEFCAAALASELLSFQGDSFLHAWSTPAPVKLQAAPMPAGIIVSTSLTKALEEMPPLQAGCVRLFLARHGETTANEKGLLCGGDLDSELNSNGEKQAEELAQEFCSLVTPEIIGSSSQRRAVRSADLVARCCPKSERLVIDDLREMRYGLLEGALIADVGDEMKSIAKAWRDGNLEERVGGERGESPKDLVVRVLHGLSRSLQQQEGKAVLLFCHSWVNKALIALATPGLGLQKLLDIPQRNCAVNVIDVDCRHSDLSPSHFRVLAVDLVAGSRARI